MERLQHLGSTRRRFALAAAPLLLVTLVALTVPLPTGAQSVSELSSRADAARERARALADRVAEQSAALDAVQTEAGAAAQREAELSGTLADGRARAADLANEVERTRERLAEARERLRRSVRVLAGRLVAIYKDGGPDEVGLLLGSDDYEEMTAWATYIERIRAADESLIDRARGLRAEVSERLGEVGAARDRQEAHNAEVATARDEIAVARERAEARATELAGVLEARTSALAELRGEVERWERELARAERISASEARQKVAAAVGDWAIPAAIVMCESGGNWSAVNPTSGAGGAYQILPSTWKLYGGKGLPHQASPAEQSRIAALIWADSGGSAWVCAA